MGFSSCSTRALEHRFSSCAWAFCCRVVCGIFPDQEWNRCLLHWQEDSLPPSHQGNPRDQFLMTKPSVQFSSSVVSDSWRPHGLQHTRPHCLSPTPRACSNSCPLSCRCYPNISSSATHFSCLQYFPASGSFPMSHFYTSGGQSIGVSASASVLPMNIQDCFPLGWTGLISIQSKELSRVFSTNTVQKHQFFDAQPPLWSNSHIHM